MNTYIISNLNSDQVSMLLETVFLTLLVSSLPLTTTMGRAGFMVWIWAIYFTFPGTYSTQPAVTTQVYMMLSLLWSFLDILLTVLLKYKLLKNIFQTFGHKYGGTIYGFLFTSDIINNLLVGALSRTVLRGWGWLGFFLVLASFGLLAFLITCFFPGRSNLVCLQELGSGPGLG